MSDAEGGQSGKGGGQGRGGGGGRGLGADLLDAYARAARSLARALPVLAGVMLLVGLFKALVTRDMMAALFGGSVLTDSLLGASIGSLAAGNPIVSYIIGGELLERGVSMYAVTAFMVAWVTVGLVQLPAEAAVLGRRFALVRNGLGFLLAFAVALLTVATLEVLS